MESKQKWELLLNTGGDPLKSMLTLNGELIACAEVSVIAAGDQPAYLNIKVPIVEGNLDIKTDTSKPVYRQVITATANKE
jgi:hypothetical protein